MQRLQQLFDNSVKVLSSPTTLKVALRSVALTGLLAFALSSALVSSIAFYRATVPSVSVIKEVFLQYGYLP
jgi:hypothetical protein